MTREATAPRGSETMREKRPLRPCKTCTPLLRYSLNHPARLASLAMSVNLSMPSARCPRSNENPTSHEIRYRNARRHISRSFLLQACNFDRSHACNRIWILTMTTDGREKQRRKATDEQQPRVQPTAGNFDRRTNGQIVRDKRTRSHR